MAPATGRGWAGGGGGGVAWRVYKSLNDHGKLVKKSNQNPEGEERYWIAIFL